MTRWPANESLIPSVVASRPRGGFTVLELLVSLAILALLSALAAPAILSSREASRRVACTNNLRQLALAVETHRERETAPLLVKRMPVLLAADLGARVTEDSSSRDYGVLSPVWRCPSQDIPVELGAFSYLPSRGMVVPGKIGAYRFFPSRMLATDEVSDGLSNTILLSEKLVSYDNLQAPNYLLLEAPSGLDARLLAKYVPFATSFPDGIAENCRSQDLGRLPAYDPVLRADMHFSSQVNGFDAILGPNDASCYDGPPTPFSFPTIRFFAQTCISRAK